MAAMLSMLLNCLKMASSTTENVVRCQHRIVFRAENTWQHFLCCLSTQRQKFTISASVSDTINACRRHDANEREWVEKFYTIHSHRSLCFHSSFGFGLYCGRKQNVRRLTHVLHTTINKWEEWRRRWNRIKSVAHLVRHQSFDIFMGQFSRHIFPTN